MDKDYCVFLWGHCKALSEYHQILVERDKLQQEVNRCGNVTVWLGCRKCGTEWNMTVGLPFSFNDNKRLCFRLVGDNVITFYNIPKWAKYIAQDEEGQWWAFNCKPEFDPKYRIWIGGRKEKISPYVQSTLKAVHT